MSKIVVSLLVAFLVSVSPARAQPTADPLLNAATALYSWFAAMLGSVNQLVEAQKRQQLIDKLNRLRGELVSVAAAKSDLVEKMQQAGPGPVTPQMRDSAAALAVSVDSLRTTVKEVSAIVLGSFGAQGDTCANLLDAAVREPKSWISHVRARRPIDQPLIDQARLAVTELRKAAAETGRLIERLP